MQDVMFDLETFGTVPGSALRSVGAVFFDLDGNLGAEFYANIDQASCEAAGLKVDPKTVAWWAQQEKAAQEALLVDPKPLSEVASSFNAFWMKNRGMRVWCQGAAFDAPLWEAAVKRVPWKFWDILDTRTLYHLNSFDPRTVKRAGTYHNALDDSKYQVACVAAAIAKGKLTAMAA